MIRLVIAEDQQMLLGALTSLIELEEDMEVLAEVTDGEKAWKIIEKEQPDVCLLDIEMPIISGLELAAKIKNANMQMPKIIIVTTFARPGYLQKAIDLEIDGYLLKDEPIDYLIDSIRKVMKGERVISTDLAATLFMKEASPLTERETEVLRLAKDGLTTSEISNVLFLTKGTVRNYLSAAIQKLHAESRQQAVRIAEEKGWI